MNLAIRGIEAHRGQKWADSFLDDQHEDLKADFILANPPCNVSDWSGSLLRDDQGWQHGIPPLSNANYAWIQHFLYRLAPSGTAGCVMANGSLSFSTFVAAIRPRRTVLSWRAFAVTYC